MGFPRCCCRPEGSSCNMLLTCPHIDRICMKASTGPVAAAPCIPDMASANRGSAQVGFLLGLTALNYSSDSCYSNGVFC